ncbi:MAG: DNA polymerase I [Lachnospiraceae bacterium]|nr:DNA polymerase I [Lachnospiraceae bacterium]
MEKLLLIDGHSILNRAFFGMPPLTTRSGIHTNAVIGFLNIMTHFLDVEKPQYLAVAFDLSAPTFRHRQYAEYKGTRKPMADELREQVPMIKQMLSAMEIPVITREGWEADDILGTLAHRAEADGKEVTIVSGDRDLLQLCTDHIKIALPRTKATGTEVENYYASDFESKHGVTPLEYIDVKALMGDSSDNIPGVPGIGEKTAFALIAQYHSIDGVHEDAANVKPPRAAKNIVEFWDQAVMSKWLATISLEAEVDYDIESARLKSIYTPAAYELCKEWEFNKFLSRFDDTAAPAAAVEAKSVSKDEAASLFGGFSGRVSLVFGENDLTFSDGQSIYRTSDISALTLTDDIIVVMRDIKTGLTTLFKNGIISSAPYNAIMSHYDSCGAAGFYDVSVAEYLDNPIAKESPAEPDTAAEAAYLLRRAAELDEELEAKGMKKLFFELELPLVFVLYDMERAGVRCEGQELRDFAESLSADIDRLEHSIYDQAGEEFNINSPKQLGVVLFEHLGLKGGKKTKTGYSTAADVLEKMAPGYPIVSDILEYRGLTKLRSTYAEGLQKCIEEDGRIHTTFQQKVTATGRLSSTEPNLQNIPTRSELGKEIRKAFTPAEGCVFVDADYSQIELRVLAHMSGDEELIRAYRENRDIHRATASLVFHTPFEEVTDAQRRNAKAVNFGIVYGISSFGLGADLDISRKEAQEYIDNYFVAYPKLKEYIDGLVSNAKETGYAMTLFNRRRPVPELSSSNFMQRSFGERVAMNSPIQGTAADIIKMAMLRVYNRLRDEGLRSRLILQVHDELIIEAYTDELDAVHRIMSEEMIRAAELSVPLEIDMHDGTSWYDAK